MPEVINISCLRCMADKTSRLTELWWSAHEEWTSTFCTVRTSRQHVYRGLVDVSRFHYMVW